MNSIKVGAALSLPFVLGGCVATMMAMATKDSSHGAQGKDYAPVTEFRSKATGFLNELTRVDGQFALALPPSKCRFADGKWNEEFRAKPFVYFGKCDQAGYADGFGGIFLKQPDGKFAPPQFSFSGTDKGFPAFVGDFKQGRPHGQGYLTVEVPTKGMYESFGFLDPKMTEAQYIVDMKKNSEGKQIPPDTTLSAWYAQARQQQEASYATWASTVRIPVYVGDFAEGRQTGKAVVISSANKLVYSGEVKDGKKHGVGRHFLPAFFAEKGRHAQSKQLTMIAAEGQFKDDLLDGVGTGIFTQCKKVTATFERGEIKPGYATYYEPTRIDAEKSYVHHGNRMTYSPTYIYGSEMTLWLDKSLQPKLRGFVSRKWQDDDFTYSLTGTYNEQGKPDGEFVATRASKKFGDVTNAKSLPLIGKEDVHATSFNNGVEKPPAETDKKTSLADWAGLLERLVKARNPSIDSASVAKGLAATTITQFEAAFGDPCEDLGEMSQNLQAKFDGLADYYKALGQLARVNGRR